MITEPALTSKILNMPKGRCYAEVLGDCDGSVEDLLVGMVDSKVLDGKELQRLAERIAAAKKGKK